MTEFQRIELQLTYFSLYFWGFRRFFHLDFNVLVCLRLVWRNTSIAPALNSLWSFDNYNCHWLPTKLREGNVFSHVCLSICLERVHVQGPNWPLDISKLLQLRPHPQDMFWRNLKKYLHKERKHTQTRRHFSLMLTAILPTDTLATWWTSLNMSCGWGLSWRSLEMSGGSVGDLVQGPHVDR